MTKRGFAGLTLERRREIASMGGKAVHKQGRSRQWTSEEAQVAGQKGGLAKRRNREQKLEDRKGEIDEHEGN